MTDDWGLEKSARNALEADVQDAIFLAVRSSFATSAGEPLSWEALNEIDQINIESAARMVIKAIETDGYVIPFGWDRRKLGRDRRLPKAG